jgi:hypothetical protein
VGPGGELLLLALLLLLVLQTPAFRAWRGLAGSEICEVICVWIC